MSLLTAGQIASLRSTVESGMVTDVTIKKQSQADNVYGDDQTETWTVSETVQGWIRTVPSGPIDVIGGITGNVSDFRLLLPVGTDCAAGDRVVVGTEEFVVTDTNSGEMTYQLALRCSLRRLE